MGVGFVTQIKEVGGTTMPSTGSGRRGGGRKPPIHVTPRGDKWARGKEAASRATSLHHTKAEAEAATRSQAKREHAELFVHGKDGQIQRRDSYGNDPFPPKR